VAKEEKIVFEKGDLRHESRKVEIWEENKKRGKRERGSERRCGRRRRGGEYWMGSSARGGEEAVQDCEKG
jgi:hypothetical protein